MGWEQQKEGWGDSWRRTAGQKRRNEQNIYLPSCRGFSSSSTPQYPAYPWSTPQSVCSSSTSQHQWLSHRYSLVPICHIPSTTTSSRCENSLRMWPTGGVSSCIPPPAHPAHTPMPPKQMLPPTSHCSMPNVELCTPSCLWLPGRYHFPNNNTIYGLYLTISWGLFYFAAICRAVIPLSSTWWMSAACWQSSTARW